MQTARRKANVKWFSNKQKGKRQRRRSPMQLVTLRLHDLAKLFRGRYGYVLPDDDAGRDDLAVAVHHLACLPHPQKPIDNWLELWAPWLTMKERRQIVGDALASPQRWKADALAWRLRLTAADRHMLGITTIGAIDESRAERVKRRRERERQRKELLRRAQGARPRKVYKAQSISKAKPWETEGISRRTWYRRNRSDGTNGTSPVTP